MRSFLSDIFLIVSVTLFSSSIAIAQPVEFSDFPTVTTQVGLERNPNFCYQYSDEYSVGHDPENNLFIQRYYLNIPGPLGNYVDGQYAAAFMARINGVEIPGKLRHVPGASIVWGSSACQGIPAFANTPVNHLRAWVHTQLLAPGATHEPLGAYVTCEDESTHVSHGPYLIMREANNTYNLWWNTLFICAGIIF